GGRDRGRAQEGGSEERHKGARGVTHIGVVRPHSIRPVRGQARRAGRSGRHSPPSRMAEPAGWTSRPGANNQSHDRGGGERQQARAGGGLGDRIPSDRARGQPGAGGRHGNCSSGPRLGLPSWQAPYYREGAMNWDELKGKWKQFAGKLRSKWAKLTDDDWALI